MSESKNQYQVGLPMLEVKQEEKKSENHGKRLLRRANDLDGATWTRWSEPLKLDTLG